MRRKMLWILNTLTVSTLALAAGVQAAELNQKEMRQADLRLNQAQNVKAVAKGDPVISAVTEDEVGDVGSFGRNMKWLGLTQTQQVSLRSDCTGTDPLLERCITLNPQPAVTSFDQRDLAQITLPGKSAKSLLCQVVTPIYQYQFHNLTGVDQNFAQVSITPYATVENEVLNDPAAIDPITGLPYGGQMDVGMAMTHQESRSLEAGERHNQRINFTRLCIAGVISEKGLMDIYGLPEELAKKFLKKETTIRFHLRGGVALVDNASLIYGFRFFGD